MEVASQNQRPESAKDYMFAAKIETIGALASLLKSIAFCDKVNLFINRQGLKFIVEEGKYVQASVIVQAGLFQEYSAKDDDNRFKIPLKELLDCLKIFCTDGKAMNETSVLDANGNTASLRLLYKRRGGPFEIILEENKVLTEFQLKTEALDDLMEFELDHVWLKASLKPDHFFELMAEIDSNNVEVLEIRSCNDETMRLAGVGISGKMEVVIPVRSDVVVAFQAQPDHISSAKYKFSVLKYAFKALQISQQLVLKMNDQGIMCWSFLLSTKVDSYVEFFIIPVIGEESD